MKRLVNEIKSYGAFLLIAMFSFWQIGFLIQSLKWDMIDGILPRYMFVSQVFANGEFPFWNPYQDLGYPIHAAFLVSIWDPLTLVIANTIGFNLIVLHLFFIGLVAIAGYGMKKLLREFKVAENTALIIAICYMLSGVFVSNTQHLRIIMAAAWLPLLICYFTRFLKQNNLISTLKFLIVGFIFLTESYQKIAVITLYIMGALFMINFFREKKWKATKNLQTIKTMSVLGGGLIILLSPFLISSNQVFSRMGRGDKLTVERYHEGSFTPQSTISYMVPLLSTVKETIGETDISMSNSYIGIISLSFMFLGLTKKSLIKENRYLLLLILLTFLLSLGPFTPLSELVFNYIPLLGNFRFPSLYRVFTIIGLCIFIAKAVDDFEAEQHKKKFIYVLVGILLILLAALLVGLFHHSELFTVKEPGKGFWQSYLNLNFSQKLVLQCSLQMTLITACIMAIIKNRYKQIILPLMLIDMFMAVNLNAPITSVNPMVSPVEVQTALDEYPRGFPVPTRKNMSEGKNDRVDAKLIWRNTSVYTKEPSYDGYNAFRLKNFTKAYDKHKGMFMATINNPIAYLSDQVFSMKTLTTNDSLQLKDHKKLFLEEQSYHRIKRSNFHHSEKDTAIITTFKPNRIELKTKTQNEQVLTVLQNHYLGWKAYIDNEETEIFTSNHTFRSIILPKGVHNVKFIYKNNKVLISFFISIITFALLVIIVFMIELKVFKPKGLLT